MSIWHYDADRLANPASGQDVVVATYMTARNVRSCPYCAEPLRTLIDERPSSDAAVRAHQRIASPLRESTFGMTRKTTRKFDAPFTIPSRKAFTPFEHILRVCPVCGWWVQFREILNLEGKESEHTIRTYGGVAALKLLSLADIDTPLTEVRAYLAARYEQRFTLDAKLFEETVGSVFGDLGYSARVTAYSGDDGIDVILDGPDDATIGVQVKKYAQKNRIKVAQIRELTGALVINGITKGIFVTTSDFQSGAARTASLSADAGHPIELYNAERFYEALRLSQLANADDFAALTQSLQRRSLRLIHKAGGV